MFDKKEHARLYYAANKEKMKATNERHRLAQKEERTEYHKKRYSDNTELFREKNKDNRVKHLDKRKAYRLAYDQTPAGKLQWRKDNNKRRELKQLHDSNYTQEDISFTFDIFNNMCFNCKSIDNIEIDHHRPLSKGFGLSRNNAVLLCKSCNASKHNKDPEEFYSTSQIEILEEVYHIV